VGGILEVRDRCGWGRWDLAKHLCYSIFEAGRRLPRGVIGAKGADNALRHFSLRLSSSSPSEIRRQPLVDLRCISALP
jgi:hypothetical protein